MNNLSSSALNEHNPFEKMKDEEAMVIQHALFNSTTRELTQVINSSSRPNIVLLLFESWTADIIEPLQGDHGITPFFTSLCDSGLLFTNIYATGRRTDQALPSLISGFPAQPDYSIIRFTEKTEKLPYLTHYFKKEGYQLSFYYGGELGFANMNSYLLYGGFEHFISEDDFPEKDLNSKWGAHDEFVFSKQLDDLKSVKQPFFSMLLTLSTHEPFEIPRPDFIKGNDTPTKFRNAARYTDECLKEYFNAASKQSWFKNTLFILVADHGHLLPRERDYYDILSHHIPLLFYGPALNRSYIGKQIMVPGNQNDLPSTLLHQFNADASAFLWSNDLLNNKRINFAYADFDESLGWVNDKGTFIFNNSTGKIDKFTGQSPDSISIQQSKAYRQFLYKSFLQLGNNN